MATLTPTYPGIYVQEVSSGVRPIQSASTSTPAFIGVAEMGPLNEAVKIYNFTEYQKRFGGFLENSFLSHSVYQFFNNGGSQCYVVRVGENLGTAEIVLKDRAATDQQTSLTIKAKSPGAWGNKLALKIEDGTNDPNHEFKLLVYRLEKDTSGSDKAKLLESFDNLSMNPSSPNFVETRTASSKYIQIKVNKENTKFFGTSQGADKPALDKTSGRKFKININGFGAWEVNLDSNVPKLTETSTPRNIADAITNVVNQLASQQDPTSSPRFPEFKCTTVTINSKEVLLLTSGPPFPSSVVVTKVDQDDASAALKLGKENQGIEMASDIASTRPQKNTTDKLYSLGEGSEGQPITSEQPFIDALDSLDVLEDVSLIAIPGRGSKAIVGAGMNYCAKRPLKDCFFLGEMGVTDTTEKLAQDFGTDISPKNSYGAVYTPWIKMLDPTGKSPEPILVPPSGYVAGLYAKTDSQRGVWKAPAGVNVGLGGAVGLATQFTDIQQGNLNTKNINVIRQFASSGIVLWGARTLTADPEWLYIPVRRMAIFLRVSIYRGIQWAVFEPNDEPLWAQLRLNLNSFMLTLFRRGAFQGATPSQAFFVKCDSETTTQDDINLGIVNVLVGFAPLKPAEFVMVEISQKAGEAA